MSETVQHRMKVMATFGAQIEHENLFDRTLNPDGAPTEGHENHGGASFGFDTCPHPDCVMVRDTPPVDPVQRLTPAWEPIDVIFRIVRRVAELSDRTSPEDWPDAMLVTGEELRAILLEELPPLVRASAPKGDQ